MTGRQLKRLNTEYIVLAILGIFILFFTLFHLKYLEGIQHAYDESGYWSSAAYFAGLDWKDMTSHNLYYAYGYGFLLFFLMKWIPVSMLYQSGIVLNAVILVFEFYLICYVLKNIFCNVSFFIITGISFTIVIYPYNLFYVHLTVSEVLLSFLFWAITALFIKLLKKNTEFYSLMLGVLVSCSYIVHQRCIGIVLASAVTMFAVFLTKNSKLRNQLIFLGTVVTLLVLANQIKQAYISDWFSTNLNVGVNDYSGQTDKLALLFSLEGVPYFISSIIGKWFGICASTFMLVSFGITGLIKDCISGSITWKKTGICSHELIIKFFWILCFFAAFGISVIFLIYPNPRADYLIYTRYTETVVFPVIAYGIYRLYIKDVSFRELIWNCVCLLFTLTVVIFRLYQTGWSEYVGQANVAIWDLYYNGMDTSTFLCMAAFRAVLICMILYLFCMKHNWRICLLLLTSLWLYIGNAAYQKDNVSRQNNSIGTVADRITDLSDYENLYYFDTADDISMEPFYLQLQNPEIPVRVLESWNQADELCSGDYILVRRYTDLKAEDLADYSVIGKYSHYMLLVKYREGK